MKDWLGGGPILTFSPEVKSCFTVLDDDGSNEVTPFEFKQLETKRIASSTFIILPR